MVAPTIRRRAGDFGHRPPDSLLDDTGQVWRGASRVVDRAGRRRQNRKSWRKLLAAGRRETMAANRARIADRAERAA